MTGSDGKDIEHKSEPCWAPKTPHSSSPGSLFRHGNSLHPRPGLRLPWNLAFKATGGLENAANLSLGDLGFSGFTANTCLNDIARPSRGSPFLEVEGDPSPPPKKKSNSKKSGTPPEKEENASNNRSPPEVRGFPRSGAATRRPGCPALPSGLGDSELVNFSRYGTPGL